MWPASPISSKRTDVAEARPQHLSISIDHAPRFERDMLNYPEGGTPTSYKKIPAQRDFINRLGVRSPACQTRPVASSLLLHQSEIHLLGPVHRSMPGTMAPRTPAFALDGKIRDGHVPWSRLWGNTAEETNERLNVGVAATALRPHGRSAGIRMLDSPFQQVSDVQDEKEGLLVELALRAVSEDDAEVVILAGAPPAGLVAKVATRIPVLVVDQVAAAAK